MQRHWHNKMWYAACLPTFLTNFRLSSFSHSFNFLVIVPVSPLPASLGAQEGYPCDKTVALTFRGPVEITKCKSVPSKHLLKMAKIAVPSLHPHCTV